MYISSQIFIKLHHVGCLKLAMVKVFIIWKLATLSTKAFFSVGSWLLSIYHHDSERHLPESMEVLELRNSSHVLMNKNILANDNMLLN